MERQFFSGNTIEQAVMAAARHYGLDPSRVAYKPRDKKHGFLNIRRRVVIEVDPAAPEKTEGEAGELREELADTSAEVVEAQGADEDARGPDERGSGLAWNRPDAARPDAARPDADRPDADRPDADEQVYVDDAAEKPPRPPRERPPRQTEEDEGADEVQRHRKALQAEFAEGSVDQDKEVAAFAKSLDEVVELIEMELEATITRQDGVIEINLEGDDGEFLVERDGLLLRAIEHLLPRMVRGLVGYGLPCKVDCNGFHEARESELREIAGGMAELVRRQGKPQKLEPMSPADRRLVHLALADDPTVSTESEGSGYMKRVKVLPA